MNAAGKYSARHSLTDQETMQGMFKKQRKKSHQENAMGEGKMKNCNGYERFGINIHQSLDTIYQSFRYHDDQSECPFVFTPQPITGILYLNLCHL